VHIAETRHADGGPVERAAADKETLAACRAGDRLALERLLTPHERPLYTLCLGILRSPEDAEDAVQEAFLRALKGLSAFRGDAAVRTWLQRIAVNVCLEWKRSRKAVVPLDCMESMPAADPPVEDTALDRVLALEALGTLKPQQRAAILLKDVEGWSVAEVAEAMKWSPKKAENELYRARLALGCWRDRRTGTRESCDDERR